MQPGARGGAMAKVTSSSDPSIPIGPVLHVVRLSGRGFGQTPVWPAHVARVCVWEGGSRCGFHSELRDSASENESLDRRWYAVVSETRVRGNSPHKINEEEWEVEWRGKLFKKIKEKQ